MKGLLRIGDLARLGGVSIKTLRFYDEQGLLRPEHVDRQTGYRYYTAEQAGALAEITNLRAVDFTIQEIAVLLSNAPGARDIAEAIARKKTELAEAQRRLAEKMHLADALIALADGRAGALRLRALEPQTVYAVKKRAPSLGRPVTEIFESAETIVATENARAPQAPFLIFHDAPDKARDILLEVCIPIDAPASVFANARETAPGFALSTVYQGGYKRTPPLYHDMVQHIARAGLRAAGPLHEIYHRFGADQEDYALPAKMLARGRAEFLTELMIPIALPATKKESSL